MARVSIILPTYNRSDTILRAIESVREQGFGDWELIVVDDGSTDDTQARLRSIDSRIRILTQHNQGVTAARNTGLQAARGELIAFLDSDDEWLPHHLRLACAFFDAFPLQHLYTCEFWEDFGVGTYLKHYRQEVSVYAPRVAGRIGSAAFRTPAPQGDPYLWFYEARNPLSEWGRAPLHGTPYSDAFHYRGNIFLGWRWEFLMSMQSTVLTRVALDKVGLPDPAIPVASDYAWLATLCRNFATNMISAPGCIKHEYATGARTPLAESHLVTGKTAIQFHLDMLRTFEELYWKDNPNDPELQGIRGYRQFKVGEAALLQGQRDLALEYLRQSVHSYRGMEAVVALAVARTVAHAQMSRWFFSASQRLVSLPSRTLRRFSRAAAARQRRSTM